MAYRLKAFRLVLTDDDGTEVVQDMKPGTLWCPPDADQSLTESKARSKAKTKTSTKASEPKEPKPKPKETKVKTKTKAKAKTKVKAKPPTKKSSSPKTWNLSDAEKRAEYDAAILEGVMSEGWVTKDALTKNVGGTGIQAIAALGRLMKANALVISHEGPPARYRPPIATDAPTTKKGKAKAKLPTLSEALT